MSTTTSNSYVSNRSFNTRTCRHTINGFNQVLHCHHYATLYTQLAMDCSFTDATKLLSEVAEDTFYQTLSTYYNQNNVTDLSDRIKIAEEQYKACGLGSMIVKYAGSYSGSVELTNSHVDEGWVAKWGKTDKPINYITAGYISGAFSAIFNKPTRTYMTMETQSIATGAPTSQFNVIEL